MTINQEATYPITFREEDTKRLADHLKHHNSVTLIGMKRVGINNFLRFFLQNPAIEKNYLTNGTKPFFVSIDLNDLVEREIFPFWTLVLKRLVDKIEDADIAEEVKDYCKKLFTESIQLKDLFVTVDSVQKVITKVVSVDFYPTIVLNRFDRLTDAITPEFFNNLQRLKDAAMGHLSYIITSYRPLYELKPEVFTKQALSVFCTDMYLKPAMPQDSSTILSTFEERYQLKVPEQIRDEFLQITGGHVQFLHLSMLKLRETEHIPPTRLELIELLINNEEALLQSDELIDTLTDKERTVLLALASEDKPESILAEVPYLTNTGMVNMRDEKVVVFSPLLRQAILRRNTQKQQPANDFTKKENLLFTYLKSHTGELCEREDIIEAVWPEYAEAGVSDWAMDRLVARVRAKLKAQQSPYEIQTVITRGYKLVNR